MAVRRVVRPVAVNEPVIPAEPDDSAPMGAGLRTFAADSQAGIPAAMSTVVVTGVSVGRFLRVSRSRRRSIASQCSIQSRW